MLDLQLGRGHPRTKAVLDAKQFDNRGGGWGARVAQWRERSPPTNVARVCCWFSLLREFQFKLEPSTHGHVSTSSYELLSSPWVNKLQITIYNNKIHNLFNLFLIIQQCLPPLQLNCNQALYYFHPCLIMAN